MLPPFGQDVASVAPFSGRLASLPLRQAVTTNRKDLKLSFTEGRRKEAVLAGSPPDRGRTWWEPWACIQAGV